MLKYYLTVMPIGCKQPIFDSEVPALPLINKEDSFSLVLDERNLPYTVHALEHLVDIGRGKYTLLVTVI